MTPNPIALATLSDLERLAVDDIIDVRSPAEFAEDHLPGAINLPALDNAERARVGSVYKQDSPFSARKLGAALVARNAARHLEGYLADKPGGYRPLVYCWRGGQRSGSLALILAQIGWRVSVLEGGWRAWRRLVVQALYDHDFPAPIRLLDGDTGTAKTALLAEVRRQGGQVLDLEGLAGHRGSIFGGTRHGQPSQKSFESSLAQAISRLDPARPVLIEAESSRIGALRLPPRLWAAMRHAPRVVIEAPLDQRARYLARTYNDITSDRERLRATLHALSPLHPRDRIVHWLALADAGAHEDLARDLMREHYDPRYARQRARDRAPTTTRLSADTLEPETLHDLAAKLVQSLD